LDGWIGGEGEVECNPMKMNRSHPRLTTTLIALYCWAAVFSLKSNPAYAQNAEADFSLALQAFRAGDKERTVAILGETLKQHPDHAPSHELLGLAFSALGKNQEALQHLREATKLWPDHPVYWTNLGIFYLGQSRTEDAETALRRSVEVDPNPPALRLLGLIRLDQQVGGEAVQYFSKALDLAPDDAESWYYLGLAQHSLAHSEEALRCYDEALKRAPGHFYAQLQIGILLLTQGQRQQALQHLQAAQVVRPQDAEVYQRLSEAYLGNGDLQQALESARRAVELMPSDRQTHYHLGLVLARLGKSDEAQKEFAISEGLPKRPETTPLERWRELHGEGLRSDGPKP
jgi:tetratricopeptide (TPR) repeat protein